VDLSTLFDIGSITKVVSTVSIIARLYEKKQLDLEEQVNGFKLRDLLTHSSGLKAWLPLYQQADKSFNSDWIAKENQGKSVYSDLGFLLIHDYLNLKFGCLENLFKSEVKEPLMLSSTGYNPDKANKNIAATEYCYFRNRLVQGEVFDENTFSLGGISTQAGIFSTSSDMALWGSEWLKARSGKSSWISKETALYFTTKIKSNWALGFDTKSEAGSTLGKSFSSDTFGHLGYPGTSIWIDPTTQSVVVFLTNHIHPSRLDARIKIIRPKLHELLFEEVLSGIK